MVEPALLYFRNTRALTLMVLGCANLESFLQLIEVQLLARFLTDGLTGQA